MKKNDGLRAGERLLECLKCYLFDVCTALVEVPEAYEDGSCKTRDYLAGRYGGLRDDMKGEK